MSRIVSGLIDRRVELRNREFWLMLVVSLVMGVAAIWPIRSMPADYHAIFWRSFPIAGFWLLLLVAALFRHRKKALWLLLGLPLVLYWPYDVTVNGLPRCYYVGACR